MIPVWLNVWQVHILTEIQRVCLPHEKILFWFSFIGDPRNCFLITFPICSAFSSVTGYRVLWISALAEWCNAVLKWIFLDDRPYWWVPEHADSFSSNVSLVQFPVTCETGPGFPSGHVMAISSTGLLLVVSIGHAAKLSFSNATSVAMHWCVWLVYLSCIVGVCLCRLFLAAHFPHQVIVAIFVGCSITGIVSCLSKSPTGMFWKAKAGILGSLGMLVIAGTTYWTLNAIGINPLSTVDKAFMWCKEREWVHIDTTPFFSLSRDIGAVFGLGLAEYCRTYLMGRIRGLSLVTDERPLSLILKCFIALFSIAVAFTIEHFQLRDPSVYVLYWLAFCKFALISVLFHCFVPIASLLIASRIRSHVKIH